MKYLQVAVGIIRNADQEVFLAQRQAGSHMAGKWEFPGGKIEAGETAEQALVRELQEETGIEATKYMPFDTAVHTYENLQVTLNFFLVEEWHGEPFGKEGQAYQWIRQQDLVADHFPPANQQLVTRLVAEALN